MEAIAINSMYYIMIFYCVGCIHTLAKFIHSSSCDDRCAWRSNHSIRYKSSTMNTSNELQNLLHRWRCRRFCNSLDVFIISRTPSIFKWQLSGVNVGLCRIVLNTELLQMETLPILIWQQTFEPLLFTSKTMQVTNGHW